MKIPICRCKGCTTVRGGTMRVASSSPAGIFRGGNWQGTAIVVISGGASLAPASYDRRLSRYISPQIEWTVVGIDERWRDGVSPSLRSSRDDRIRHGFQSQENQPVLILLARLPADGVHPPTVPGDTRCDRLPARLRAGWFDLLPTECGHVNQFSDWPPGSAWHSSLGGNS